MNVRKRGSRGNLMEEEIEKESAKKKKCYRGNERESEEDRLY